MSHSPMITNDAVVLGLLAAILGLVFWTHQKQSAFWRRLYMVCPALLLCYFLPSLLNTFGIVDGHQSKLYFVASRYLLPTALVLLTLSIDIKGIIALGPRALILFLTGTVGIVIGGPIALLVVAQFVPEVIGNHGPEAVWRGMTTVAGSWIGGGANQAAMKEVYGVGQNIFSAMVTVDIIVANLWMAVLLLMANRASSIDDKIGADTTALNRLRDKAEAYQAQKARNPALADLMMILAWGFGITALAHFGAERLALFFGSHFPQLKQYNLDSAFFWLVVIATTAGLILSFTRVRELEAVGASKVASVMIYFLVAAIGMGMDITAIANTPIYFVIGLVWMAIHAGLMLIMCRLLKAPVFYMAVGSQANVGGAASAPVVASAFHPSLAPVGVLLAVFGYALGTYMSWFCGQLLQVINA